MSTTPHNVLHQARQGNPDAIAALMNQHLQTRGITAQVSQQGDALHIALESAQALAQQDLVAYIKKGVSGLSLAEIHHLEISGKQSGHLVPAWTESIVIQHGSSPVPAQPDTPAISPLDDNEILEGLSTTDNLELQLEGDAFADSLDLQLNGQLPDGRGAADDLDLDASQTLSGDLDFDLDGTNDMVASLSEDNSLDLELDADSQGDNASAFELDLDESDLDLGDGTLEELDVALTNMPSSFADDASPSLEDDILQESADELNAALSDLDMPDLSEGMGSQPEAWDQDLNLKQDHDLDFSTTAADASLDLADADLTLDTDLDLGFDTASESADDAVLDLVEFDLEFDANTVDADRLDLSSEPESAMPESFGIDDLEMEPSFDTAESTDDSFGMNAVEETVEEGDPSLDLDAGLDSVEPVAADPDLTSADEAVNDSGPDFILDSNVPDQSDLSLDLESSSEIAAEADLDVDMNLATEQGENFSTELDAELDLNLGLDSDESGLDMALGDDLGGDLWSDDVEPLVFESSQPPTANDIDWDPIQQEEETPEHAAIPELDLGDEGLQLDGDAPPPTLDWEDLTDKEDGAFQPLVDPEPVDLMLSEELNLSAEGNEPDTDDIADLVDGIASTSGSVSDTDGPAIQPEALLDENESDAAAMADPELASAAAQPISQSPVHKLLSEDTVGLNVATAPEADPDSDEGLNSADPANEGVDFSEAGSQADAFSYDLEDEGMADVPLTDPDADLSDLGEPTGMSDGDAEEVSESEAFSFVDQAEVTPALDEAEPYSEIESLKGVDIADEALSEAPDMAADEDMDAVPSLDEVEPIIELEPPDTGAPGVFQPIDEPAEEPAFAPSDSVTALDAPESDPSSQTDDMTLIDGPPPADQVVPGLRPEDFPLFKDDIEAEVNLAEATLNDSAQAVPPQSEHIHTVDTFELNSVDAEDPSRSASENLTTDEKLTPAPAETLVEDTSAEAEPESSAYDFQSSLVDETGPNEGWVDESFEASDFDGKADVSPDEEDDWAENESFAAADEFIEQATASDDEFLSTSVNLTDEDLDHLDNPEQSSSGGSGNWLVGLGLGVVCLGLLGILFNTILGNRQPTEPIAQPPVETPVTSESEADPDPAEEEGPVAEESEPEVEEPTDPESTSVSEVPAEALYFRDAVNAAQNAANLAQTASTGAEWQAVADSWAKAIDLMKQVPESDPNYPTAQQKAVDYLPNLEYAQQNAEQF